MMASVENRRAILVALRHPLTFRQLIDTTGLEQETVRSALRIMLRTREIVQVSADRFGHSLYLEAQQ